MRRNDEVEHDDMELLVENADNRDPKRRQNNLGDECSEPIHRKYIRREVPTHWNY